MFFTKSDELRTSKNSTYRVHPSYTMHFPDSFYLIYCSSGGRGLTPGGYRFNCTCPSTLRLPRSIEKWSHTSHFSNVSFMQLVTSYSTISAPSKQCNLWTSFRHKLICNASLFTTCRHHILLGTLTLRRNSITNNENSEETTGTDSKQVFNCCGVIHTQVSACALLHLLKRMVLICLFCCYLNPKLY